MLWAGDNPLHMFIFLGSGAAIPGVIAIVSIFTNPAKRRMPIFVAAISFAWFLYAMSLIPSLCEHYTNDVLTLTCYRLFFTSSYFREYVLD